MNFDIIYIIYIKILQQLYYMLKNLPKYANLYDLII